MGIDALARNPIHRGTRLMKDRSGTDRFDIAAPAPQAMAAGIERRDP
jgi:hypothetical protein